MLIRHLAVAADLTCGLELRMSLGSKVQVKRVGDTIEVWFTDLELDKYYIAELVTSAYDPALARTRHLVYMEVLSLCDKLK